MKNFDYEALSENMNVDLSALESATYMLSIANKQYRMATERNLDRKVIDFFSMKVSVYSEYRENLYSDITYDMLELKTSLFNRMIDDKRILWNEFTKAFPNSNLKFEDVFVKNVAVYPEAKDKIEKGNVDGSYSNLSKAFYEYAVTFIENEQLGNFECLLSDIYNKVNNMGAVPFIEPKLSNKNAKVPCWLIEQIENNSEIEYGNLRKQALKLGVSLRKLNKLKKSKANNETVLPECEKLENQYNDVNTQVMNMDDMFLGLDTVVNRAEASTKKWKFGEVDGQLIEKIFEFGLSIPKDIKKLTPLGNEIIISKAEAQIIANNALYNKNTILNGLLLAKYANINPMLKLSEIEHSKRVVSWLKEKEAQLKNNLVELNKNQVVNQEEVYKLNNYLNALNVLHFETPVGVVNYSNGQLVNVTNNQPYSEDVVFELNNQKQTQNTIKNMSAKK